MMPAHRSCSACDKLVTSIDWPEIERVAEPSSGTVYVTRSFRAPNNRTGKVWVVVVILGFLFLGRVTGGAGAAARIERRHVGDADRRPSVGRRARLCGSFVFATSLQR